MNFTVTLTTHKHTHSKAQKTATSQTKPAYHCKNHALVTSLSAENRSTSGRKRTRFDRSRRFPLAWGLTERTATRASRLGSLTWQTNSPLQPTAPHAVACRLRVSLPFLPPPRRKGRRGRGGRRGTSALGWRSHESQLTHPRSTFFGQRLPKSCPLTCHWPWQHRDSMQCRHIIPGVEYVWLSKDSTTLSAQYPFSGEGGFRGDLHCPSRLSAD